MFLKFSLQTVLLEKNECVTQFLYIIFVIFIDLILEGMELYNFGAS